MNIFKRVRNALDIALYAKENPEMMINKPLLERMGYNNRVIYLTQNLNERVTFLVHTGTTVHALEHLFKMFIQQSQASSTEIKTVVEILNDIYLHDSQMFWAVESLSQMLRKMLDSGGYRRCLQDSKLSLSLDKEVVETCLMRLKR